MNDRHLFKAKHLHTLKNNIHLDGIWVKGYLVDEKYIVSAEDGYECLIDPKTICQCTGLKDKKGILIWENDVVDLKIGKAVVIWDKAEWRIKWIKDTIWRRDLHFWANEDDWKCEVIGNTFDNPELLETLELGAEKTKERKIPLGLKVGDKFDLAGTNWTILDIKEEGYFCLADSIGDRAFDSESNNWTTSALREHLNTEFAEKISDEIGEENIIKFDRDLISLDGQTEYGNCLDLVSLLTVDEYREYRKFIPNTCDGWWLASPWSTPCNNDKTWEAVVSPSGSIHNLYCNCDDGVRPVCIFSSAIFEN